MIQEKYLYFRTQPDQANDDGSDDSVMFPASRLTGMAPSAAGTLTLFFESLQRRFPTGLEVDHANNFDNHDSVVLAITSRRHKEVMKSIVQAINEPVSKNGGFIVVADDVTTTYLTSSAGADETVSAVVIDSNITSCGAITIKEVYDNS